jgi:type II secretory pathway component GspD/PulD (secretin)
VATSGEEIPIKIIGVRRTSRILLVGRPSDLIAAEAMVRSFDQPSSGNTRKTFRLRYLRIADFLPIAQDAITVTLGDGAGGQGGGAAGSNRQLAGQNNNSRNNTNNTTNNNRNTGQQGGQGAAGGNRASIQEQDIPTAPESVLVGNTLLVGDNVANTIIVNGPPHHIEIVRDLIADLDTESQQVALSAVVGSYNIGDGMNFGIDLARAIRQTGSSFVAGGAGRFGNGVIDPDVLADLGNILTAQGVTGAGVSIYGAINDDFAFFVNALESQTKFKTLERTLLTTRNNRVAELSSGQRIAIPSSTFVGGTTNGQTTNVEYRDVTLELLIQPLINADDQITLEISLVRDSIGADRAVGELTVPDINTEQLSTSVTVLDGSAVVLGGIVTTTDRDTKTGIPFISRIPGLGRLFGNTMKSQNESELIIMIQPRILKSQKELDGFRDDYTRSTRHTGDVIQNFPQQTGVLPANGTMPRYNPNPKGGILPVAQRAPSTSTRPATSSARSKSKIRGRPGGR